MRPATSPGNMVSSIRRTTPTINSMTTSSTGGNLVRSRVLGKGFNSNFYTLSGFRLDDFDFGMAGAYLVLEPLLGFFFPVTQQDRAWFHLSYKVEQFVAVGVSGEIKVL